MQQCQMTQWVTTLSLLAAQGLLAACSSEGAKFAGSGGNSGSNGGAENTGGSENAGGTGPASGGSTFASDAGQSPNCISNDAFICAADLSGFPFVRVVTKSSDYCSYLGTNCAGVIAPAVETTVNLSQPKAGTLCLAGTVSPGGWALLALEVAEKTLDRKKILQPFDASGYGITQLTVQIDSPPVQGIDVQANVVQQLECPVSAMDCFYPPNFDFKTITVPGQVTAGLAAFKSSSSSQVLNSSALHSFVFQVFGAGAFDFCIHDFKFLDAQGNEVMDTQ